MDSIILNITERCNLSCTYCNVVKSDRRMGTRTIRDALDLLDRDSHVDIGLFGGEPLMEPDLIQFVMQECRARFGRFTISITTNGTLVSKEILDIFDGIDVRFAVSIDGICHDACRVYKDGKGSLDDTMKGIRMILSAYPRTVAMMTFTPETIPHLSESVAMIAGMGFRYVAMTPDYTRKDWDLSMIRGYIEQAFVTAKEKGLSILGSDRSEDRCGIGDRLFVDTDGTFYPCISFKGHRSLDIGNDKEGLSSEKMDRIRHMVQFCPERCIACEFARECRRRCGCLRLQSTGDLHGISEIACEFEKAFIAPSRRGRLPLGNPPVLRQHDHFLHAIEIIRFQR